MVDWGPLSCDKGLSLAYVLTWRNACDMEGHFYAPWPGQVSAEDFRAFADMEKIVMIR